MLNEFLLFFAIETRIRIKVHHKVYLFRADGWMDSVVHVYCETEFLIMRRKQGQSSLSSSQICRLHRIVFNFTQMFTSLNK